MKRAPKERSVCEASTEGAQRIYLILGHYYVSGTV